MLVGVEQHIKLVGSTTSRNITLPSDSDYGFVPMVNSDYGFVPMVNSDHG